MNEIDRELKSERNLRLCKDSKVDKAIFQFLRDTDKPNEKAEELKKLEDEFFESWNERRLDLEDKYADDELKLQKIQSEMNESFIQFLNNQKKAFLTQALKKSLLEHYKCAVYIHEQFFFLTSKSQEVKRQISEKYCNDHKIKSLVYSYRQEQIESLFQKAREPLLKDFEEKISVFLNNFPEKKYVFEDLNNFLQILDKNTNELYSKVPLIPRKIFSMQRNIFPPWEVEIVERNNTGADGKTLKYYYLKKYQTIEFPTDHFGWRITIWFFRFYVWTNNIMFWLFFMAISSPIGIKALLYKDKFYIDKKCNINTGEVTDVALVRI